MIDQPLVPGKQLAPGCHPQEGCQYPRICRRRRSLEAFVDAAKEIPNKASMTYDYGHFTLDGARFVGGLMEQAGFFDAIFSVP